MFRAARLRLAAARAEAMLALLLRGLAAPFLGARAPVVAPVLAPRILA